MDQTAPLFDQLGEGVDESALTVSMATDSGGGGGGGKKNKVQWSLAACNSQLARDQTVQGNLSIVITACL